MANTAGERALKTADKPKISASLPDVMKREATLSYSSHHEMELALLDLLGIAPGVSLEEFVPSGDVWNVKGRKTLQARVREHAPTIAAYQRIIREVIAPHLREELLKQEDSGRYMDSEGSFSIKYQCPPTLRIHEARDKRFRRLHRDAEYGHQDGEINFWMPLTDASAGRSSLWVESEPEKVP